jgi:hypothetical protein
MNRNPLPWSAAGSVALTTACDAWFVYVALPAKGATLLLPLLLLAAAAAEIRKWAANLSTCTSTMDSCIVHRVMPK